MSIPALQTLDATVIIDENQVKDFQKNGHTLIRNVVKENEMATYRDAINKATYKYNTEKRSLDKRDTYGKAFLQIMNLWQADEGVKKFTLAKRFAKIAADLLGVEKVRIYHDQALYKEPGGGFTPWHQDQYYWPLNTNKTVTMWMPLIDINEDMGMLTFASGSHTSGFVENIAISDESEKKLEQHIKEKGFSISRPSYMQAGDATWHYGWTLHSAPGNASTAVTREVMTIIYFEDGAQVTAPQNKHQEDDRRKWLCGISPGSMAASSLNPIV